MNSNWIIKLADGTEDIVQCFVCGVSQDGSLIAFEFDVSTQQPQAIRGYAPGEWKRFTKSLLKAN